MLYCPAISGPWFSGIIVKMQEVLRLHQWTCAKFYLLTIVLAGTSLVIAAFEADLVEKLPGQPAVSFKQYAGYVNVDEKADRALFYYFAESEEDPASKPLVLWLNGGPGCSSVGLGAFTENGPFQPSERGLIKNEYAWNKEANVLYLESPAGVGFSYSNTISDLNRANDSNTAQDNLTFLLRWVSKFPEYKERDLYLAGESYAGHYIPQLATLLLNYNKESRIKFFSLKGIAIGNPLLDLQVDTFAKPTFLWSHGLISDQTYHDILIFCNGSQLYDRMSFRRNNVTVSAIDDDDKCIKSWSSMQKEIGDYVDFGDVTLNVCLRPQATLMSRAVGRTTEPVDVCLSDEITDYLNRADVQDALHANVTRLKYPWTKCSSVLQYDSLSVEIPIIPILKGLIQEGLWVLIYSGDQDSVVPLLSTRSLIHGLAVQMKFKQSVPYGPWFEDGQVGGWTEEHGGQVCYATVRGAAHEVPFSQPARALTLFKSFLARTTPPLHPH